MQVVVQELEPEARPADSPEVHLQVSVTFSDGTSIVATPVVVRNEAPFGLSVINPGVLHKATVLADVAGENAGSITSSIFEFCRSHPKLH